MAALAKSRWALSAMATTASAFSATYGDGGQSAAAFGTTGEAAIGRVPSIRLGLPNAFGGGPCSLHGVRSSDKILADTSPSIEFTDERALAFFSSIFSEFTSRLMPARGGGVN